MSWRTRRPNCCGAASSSPSGDPHIIARPQRNGNATSSQFFNAPGVYWNANVCIAGASMEESLTEAGNRPVAAMWPQSNELMTLPAESAPPLAPAGTVDPIWLKSYPADTPKTIDPDSYRVAARHAAGIVPAARRAAGVRKLAGAHDLWRVGPRQPRLCGVPARRIELPRRRPRRDHAAEHAGLSGRVPRHAACRLDRGQRQSALHAARAQGAAQGLRRHDNRHHGEFRPQARAGHRRHRHPPRRGGAARRFRAGAQALGVQFRQLLYPARRAGVALRLVHDAAGCLQPRAGRALRRCGHPGDGRGAVAIYRRHHRRAERRDADAPQSDRQHAAMPGVDRSSRQI